MEKEMLSTVIPSHPDLHYLGIQSECSYGVLCANNPSPLCILLQNLCCSISPLDTRHPGSSCRLQHVCLVPSLVPFSHCKLCFLGNFSPFVWIHKHLDRFFAVNKENFHFMEKKMHSKDRMSHSTFFLVVVSFVLLWIFFIIVSVSLKKKKGKKPPKLLSSCAQLPDLDVDLNKQAKYLQWYRTLLHAKWNGCGERELLQLVISDLAPSFRFPCYFVNRFWFQWNQLLLSIHRREILSPWMFSFDWLLQWWVI